MSDTSQAVEPPLPRPGQASHGNFQYEAPLERPTRPTPVKAFNDCGMALAVDVSGSTAGPVLRHEKFALRTIMSLLTTQALARSRIVPWDHEVFPHIGLDNIDDLQSRGGTKPSVLLASTESTKQLCSSDMWFLCTDGAINDSEILTFASKVNEHKLHNRACVCVLFGYRTDLPVDCNISVGMSLYAMTPDSAFLFHDIDTGQLFVLLAKGCFAFLSRMDADKMVIDSTTAWDDLSITSYDKLCQAQIKLPRDIKTNEILLQNGAVLDLDRFARNELPAKDVDAMLSSPVDYGSVVAAMKVSGKSQELRSWTEQQVAAMAPDMKTRPMSHKTDGLVREILTILRKDEVSRKDNLLTKQTKLRDLHQDNWIRLKRRTDYATNKRTALRMGDDRLNQIDQEQKSPSMLTPIQSPTVKLSIQSDDGDDAAEHRTSSIFRSLYPSRLRATSPAASPASSSSSLPDYIIELPQDASSTKSHRASNTLTYCPGFFFGQENVGTRCAPAVCPVCGDHTSSLALLLKEPPPGSWTDGFPTPNSVCEVRYPLALAQYRETDILSQFCCCDPCAYYISSVGTSIYDEKIVAALPVAAPLSSPENKYQWMEVLDRVFDGRFEKRNLLAITLAILSESVVRLRKASQQQNEALEKALEHVLRGLRDACKIPYANRSGTIDEAIIYYLWTADVGALVCNFTNPLFEHPLDSFAMLIANTTVIRYQHKLTIAFQRLVLLIFHNLVDGHGRDYLRTMQRSYLDSIVKDTQTAVSNERRSVHPEQLLHYHILTEDQLSALKILGSIWKGLEETTGEALHTCLCELAKEDLSIVPSPAKRLAELAKLESVFNEIAQRSLR